MQRTEALVEKQDDSYSEILDVKAFADGLERIAAVAATGVDYISVGALTHSVRTLDLGLDF